MTTNPIHDPRPPLQQAVEKLEAREPDRWPGLRPLGAVLHHAALEGA